ITVRPARIARILGVRVPDAEVEAIFARLGLKPQRQGEDLVVTPPSYRFDLAIEADLIEEVARLHGYDRIESPSSAHAHSMLPAPETARPVNLLRGRLIDRDYQEVINFSFVNPVWERALRSSAPPIAVLNPIASDLGVMRTTLLGGLLDTLRSNVN